MLILGIDTSGSVAAAALYQTDTEQFLSQQTIFTKKTHSQVILPLVERLLSDTGYTMQDIHKVAVANGPGSYTGLRIGIATVKALSFGLQIPCAGVSTLEGMAWQNLAFHGYICPIITARKTIVYAGIYHSDGKTITCVQADKMLEADTLAQQLQGLSEPILLCGDGYQAMEDHEKYAIAPPNQRLQNATGLCLAAVDASHDIDANALMPEYLQLVKAEKDRMANL